MDESDLTAHEGGNAGSPGTPLTRVRLWTRTVSSQPQPPNTVDEAHTTSRIVDFSSLAARLAPFTTLHRSTAHLLLEIILCQRLPLPMSETGHHEPTSVLRRPVPTSLTASNELEPSYSSTALIPRKQSG